MLSLRSISSARVAVEDLVDHQWLVVAVDLNFVEDAELVLIAVFESFHHVLADDQLGLIVAGQLLYTKGDIDCIGYDGGLHAFSCADDTEYQWAEMDAEADLNFGGIWGDEFIVELRHGFLHADDRADPTEVSIDEGEGLFRA